MSFTKKSSYNRHNQRKHPVSVGNLISTKKGFLMLESNEIHNSISDINCKHCDFKSSIIKHFQKHMMTMHNKEKIYECDQCNKSFSKKSTLRDHKLRVHSNIMVGVRSHHT